MRREKASEIIGGINEKYIAEAALFAAAEEQKRTWQPRRFRWGLAAACAGLAVIISCVSFTMAAEAREYKAAITFFEENGLSPEGLSRSELKAVYRDIHTKRFAYSKTADVIARTVPGWEIGQDEPTPEEIADLWYRYSAWDPVTDTGISYCIRATYAYDDRKGTEVFEKSTIGCYQDGALLWTGEFTDFEVEGYASVQEGTAVWGRDKTMSASDTAYGWIACIDSEGKVMWQQRLDHGFGKEYVASVLSNGDGTWAVISRGDLKYLCLSIYDAAGKEIAFQQTEVGNYGIWNAAKLGDAYIVQLGNLSTHDTAKLVRLDRAGHVIENYAYTAEDCEYYITDMAGFGGQVYLSAYAVPKQEDEGGRHEIAEVLDAISAKVNNGQDISSEELTPVVRDNYTAVLLLCDPDGGVPGTFYSVNGSLGGQLAVDDAGQLAWDVESITSTYYSPAINTFTIGGSCDVFRYTFDAEGSLTGQTDTGESVPFLR